MSTPSESQSQNPQDNTTPIQHPPLREIRANYDDTHITVYAAFPTSIASAAVTNQRLSAAPGFKKSRMTWIKPSWCWMMYRSGYSYKDPGQERILALKVKRGVLERVLRRARLSSHEPGSKQGAKKESGGKSEEGDVVVQWDPERGPRLEKYEYRSIQVGGPAGLIDEIVDHIEDVTDKARQMKRVLDEEEDRTFEVAELVKLGVMPVEKRYGVDEDIGVRLGMNMRKEA